MIERIIGAMVTILSLIILLFFVLFLLSDKGFASETVTTFLIMLPLVVVIVMIGYIYRLIFPVKSYTLTDFRKELIAFEITTEDKIMGCSEQEIREVMDAQNAEFLPNEYVMFLRMSGKPDKRLRSETGLFYPGVLKNMERVMQKVDKPNWRMPPNLFFVSIFDDTESFQITYFKLNHNEQRRVE